METSFGNIKKLSLKKIWNSKKAMKFRKKCKKIDYFFCKDCIYNYLNNKLGKQITNNL
ncbi:MAG: SPASM domain-containing protein [Candidatus Iainarchaeum sp.]